MSEAPQARPLSIYLVAGEESGDALGGALARALTARAGDSVKLAGVGGRAMVMCNHSVGEAALGLQWHVIGIYQPASLKTVHKHA